MSRAEFYEMRVGEFWEAWAAFNDARNAERRHTGELARGVALRLFNIQLRKKDQIKDPSKFWPMPWDEPAEEDEIVKELNAMSDDERSEHAKALLKKIGW